MANVQQSFIKVKPPDSIPVTATNKHQTGTSTAKPTLCISDFGKNQNVDKTMTSNRPNYSQQFLPFNLPKRVSGGILRESPPSSHVSSSGAGNQPSITQQYRTQNEPFGANPESNNDDEQNSNKLEKTDIYKNVEGNKSNRQQQDMYKSGVITEIQEPPDSVSNESFKGSIPEGFNNKPTNNYQTAPMQRQPPPSQTYQSAQSFQGNSQPTAPPSIKRESSSSNLNTRTSSYPSAPAVSQGMQKLPVGPSQRPIVPPQNQSLAQRPPNPQQAHQRAGFPSPINYPPSPGPRSNTQNYTSSPRPPSINQRPVISTPYSSNASNFALSVRPSTTSSFNYPPRTLTDSSPRPTVNDNSRMQLQIPSNRPSMPTYSDDEKSNTAGGQDSISHDDSAKAKLSTTSVKPAVDIRPKLEHLTESSSNRATPPPLTRSNSDLKSSLPAKKENDFVETVPNIDEEEGSDFESLNTDQEIPFHSQDTKAPTNNSVSSSIKFFEANDKAKVPLLPKFPSTDRPKDVKPKRPIDIPLKRDSQNNEDSRGVDESPVKHPNLRSTSLPPQKVALIKSGKEAGLHRSRSVCSSKSSKKIVTIAPAYSTPQTPKKAAYVPGEILLDFFHSTSRKNRIFHVDDADNDSGVDEGKESGPANCVNASPKKTPSRSAESAKRTASSPVRTPMKSPGTPGKTIAKTPELSLPATPHIKKIPMNKVQVGAAPSPNLKSVKSKIGSLANTTHKPGGGNVRIESQKLDFSSAQSRVAAKNATYAPSGGDKKITHVKLQWNAKSKIGSLDNASYKPGGGEKKIESVKLDFKDKAKPKVGSTDNIKHVPGGGKIKSPSSIGEETHIENQKVDIKAQSKVGSFENVKHKPGGGDVTIFDDRNYIKQISNDGHGSGTQKECELSIVSEVRSSEQPDVPEVKIKKTTTISNPEIRKTTEVIVSNKSGATKSPTKQEVKLTYSSVQSPKKKAPATGPVDVAHVFVPEHASILNPSEVEKKEAPIQKQNPPLTSVKDDLMDGSKTQNNSNQQQNPPLPLAKDGSTMEGGKKQDEITRQLIDSTTPASKFIQNELATHEKVGEIWKEVHNINLMAKPNEKQQPQNDNMKPNVESNSNKEPATLQQSIIKPQPVANPPAIRPTNSQMPPQNPEIRNAAPPVRPTVSHPANRQITVRQPSSDYGDSNAQNSYNRPQVVQKKEPHQIINQPPVNSNLGFNQSNQSGDITRNASPR